MSALRFLRPVNQTFKRSIHPHALYQGSITPLRPDKLFLGLGWHAWPTLKNNPRPTPKTIHDHVYENSSLTSLTSSRQVAENFASHGGWGENDPETSSSKQKTGTIAVINPEYLSVIIDVESILSQSSKKAAPEILARVKQEQEVVTTIVCPFAISHWILNGVTYDNPLYIPMNDQNRAAIESLTSKHTALLEIMANVPGRDKLNDEKCQAAFQAYIKEYAALCGEPEQFLDNINKLLTAAELDRGSIDSILKNFQNHLSIEYKASPTNPQR